MAQCKAKTKTGKPCNVPALKGHKFCFTHSPEVGAARAAAHRLGGERNRIPHAGNPSTIPQDVKNLEDAKKILLYALAEILAMDNSLERTRILILLHGEFVKSLEVGELEARIQALEQRTK